MMARVEERDLFARAVLASVGAAASELGDGFMVDGFLAMEGSRYQRELMVVGRAVNGWGCGFVARDLQNPAAANAFANQVLAGVNGSGPRPMLWVTDHWQNAARDQYNSARSAFWRVIREVTSLLGVADPEDPAWPSHLVWSNLYKVSPNGAGNPNSRLAEVQLPGCIKLLDLELATYQPRRLLFLTGRDWAEPFLGPLGFCPASNPDTRWVEAAGTVTHAGSSETTMVVVAKHPQCKPEGDWVREVVGAFEQRPV